MRPVVPQWREQRAVLLLFIVVVSFVIFVRIPVIASGPFVLVSIGTKDVYNVVGGYTQVFRSLEGRLIAAFEIAITCFYDNGTVKICGRLVILKLPEKAV